MKISGLLLGFVLLCCACGCQTDVAVMKYENGRLTVYDYDYRFAQNLELEQDIGRRTDEGFLAVQIRVRNRNNHNFACKYRFIWIDKNGIELWDGRETVESPLVLIGCEEQTLQATAPHPSAVDFRLEFRPQR